MQDTALTIIEKLTNTERLKDHASEDPAPRVLIKGKEALSHGIIRLGGVDLDKNKTYVATLGNYPFDSLPTELKEFTSVID